MINSDNCLFPVTPANKNGWPWIAPSPIHQEYMPDGNPWPRISIVTPSYNQGQFIEETLRSVLLQGYPNLEYILIDGGSTDGSVEIIEKYAPWLSYWVSEPDRGQTHAINKGFERATGDIMAWLNSDDVYMPWTLAAVAQGISGNEACLLIGSSIDTFTPDRLEGCIDDRKPTWQEMVFEARTFPQPSVFWTRDLWLLVKPLDESLYYVMDYDLWVRMRSLVHNEIHLDQSLSITRNHPLQKGKLARVYGTQNFRRERARVALHAAKQRGERYLFYWSLKTWFYNIKQRFPQKGLAAIKGSDFSRELVYSLIHKKLGI